MKRNIIFLLILLLNSVVNAQEVCGSDLYQETEFQKNPGLRNFYNSIERQASLASANRSSKLNESTIYYIPVVVHVVKENGTNKSMAVITDSKIREWIDFVNEYFEKPLDGGRSFPFRLVLATVDENGDSTTGVVYHDGTKLPNYVEYGVKNGGSSNAVTTTDLQNFAYWDSRRYMNIHLVHDLGNANGWAGYPSGINQGFVLGVGFVLEHYATTAHETGHALGLMHTFEGATSSGCPTSDCNLSGDQVCDTPPHKSPGRCYSPNDINECTGELYGDVVINIMNYEGCKRSIFTMGQAERAVNQYLFTKNTIVNSVATKPYGDVYIDKKPVPPKVACTPIVSTKNINDLGINYVKLGTIENYSHDRGSTKILRFVNETNNYIDYTVDIKPILTPIFTAHLEKSEEHTITVGLSPIGQTLKVYIDYNDDGDFNDVGEEIVSDYYPQATRKSFSFIAPDNVVVNKPLRIRFMSNRGTTNIDSCFNVEDGQIEDYTVVFSDKNSINNNNKQSSGIFKIILNKEG